MEKFISDYNKRKEGWSSFQENRGESILHYEHGGSELRTPSLQEDDGKVAVRDAHKHLQIRHTPYIIQSNNRRVRWHNKDLIYITVWQDRRGPKMELEKRKYGNSRSWFKIIVPYGRKSDKIWLLNSNQSHCSVPFTPFDHAQFFIQDSAPASVLKAIHRFWDEENQKISIIINPSVVYHFLQNILKPEQIEQLRLAMNKWYVSQQVLDFQNFHFDPEMADRSYSRADLVGYNIDMNLNGENSMVAMLKIIKENFLESLPLNLCSNKHYQLDDLPDTIQKASKVKNLNPSKHYLKSAWEFKELSQERNSLCDTLSDQSTNISDILESFSKLLCLDDKDSLPPTTPQIEASEIRKPCKESYKSSETLKDRILQFLQEFYWIYDYGDRQGLLDTYHDEACFSLAIPSNPEDPAPNRLGEYSKSSRNMKKLTDSILRIQLLKHKKHDIVDFLSVLPKTQHDLRSFVVDIFVQTEKMLCFSVNGLFKKEEGMCQTCICAFNRIVIATPARNSSLFIMNDQLSVREVSPKATQSAFSTPVPTSTSSSVPILSQKQQKMIQAFSIQSGMNLQWSLKCLEDNEWNYNIAEKIFTMLKAAGKIPEKAFK